MKSGQVVVSELLPNNMNTANWVKPQGGCDRFLSALKPSGRCFRRQYSFMAMAGFCLLLTGGVKANLVATNELPDSAELSLEQLINIQVTSVSKKETSLSQAPAAISVVTQEDIRRFGITSLPEALRLVPGLDVARINSHEWAVSSRGFNSQYATKLLVLVDGRSVYGTGFGGVVWGVQDVVMEDLDRIEVIRGPGGTLWGANAVNGVINIITKSAKETQGALIATSGGTEDRPATTVQYGGQLNTNLYYRAYLKYYNREGMVTAAGGEAPDKAQELQGGLRLDWEPGNINKLTLQGDYYADRFTENQYLPSLQPPYGQNLNEVNHDSGGNVLGRWTHDFSASSVLTVQAYYDHLQNEQAQATEFVDTIDFDAQHQFALGDRQAVMWGLGYRHLADQFDPSVFAAWNPATHDEQLFSAFVQDEVTLVPDRFKVTVGSKFEHNDYTGYEVQPSARLAWTPTEKQTIWAAVSRSVRTPSRNEQAGRANLLVYPPYPPNPLPTLVSTLGTPNLESEALVAYELGYRIEITKRCSVDATCFYNTYNRLIVPVAGPPLPVEPGAFPLHSLYYSTFVNAVGSQTYGAELTIRWNPTDHWHLMAGYAWMQMTCELDTPIMDSYPQQQFQIRSALDLPGNLEFNSAVYFVGATEAPYGVSEINLPAYFRLDLGLVWHPTKSLEIGVWGQNLQQDRHAEFTSYKTSLITEIPRSVLGKITWRF